MITPTIARKSFYYSPLEKPTRYYITIQIEHVFNRISSRYITSKTIVLHRTTTVFSVFITIPPNESPHRSHITVKKKTEETRSRDLASGEKESTRGKKKRPNHKYGRESPRCVNLITYCSNPRVFYRETIIYTHIYTHCAVALPIRSTRTFYRALPSSSCFPLSLSLSPRVINSKRALSVKTRT